MLQSICLCFICSFLLSHVHVFLHYALIACVWIYKDYIHIPPIFWALDIYLLEQVLWYCFDRLELSPSIVKNVLLFGYSNGFQVLDVDDGSNFSELVSTRDDPVTFLQIQPTHEETEGHERFKLSHPFYWLWLVKRRGFQVHHHTAREMNHRWKIPCTLLELFAFTL